MHAPAKRDQKRCAVVRVRSLLTQLIDPFLCLQPTLLDQYEYGMCGKVFRYEHVADHKVSIIISFGGLLMQLLGEARHLALIRMDQKVYALFRRASK